METDQRGLQSAKATRPEQTRRVPSRARAWAFSLGALASLAAGLWIYGAMAPAIDILAVELGGSTQNWPLPDGTGSAITWDYLFILCYGLALGLGTTLARQVFWSAQAARIARVGQGTAIVAVVADLAENLLLTSALRGVGSRGLVLDAAATAATVKFATVLVAAGVALLGVGVTIARLLWSRRGVFEAETAGGVWDADTVRVPDPVEVAPPEPRLSSRPSEGHGLGPAAGVTPDEVRWRRAYDVPGIDRDALGRRTAEEDVVGFCLSGGGIRSASVSLGALQSLRAELRGARYLVSISGGGYTAGAFAHLLTDAGDRDQLPRDAVAHHDPATAFMPGTVEFDHIRRHSSYLADTAPRMLVALGVLARGLLTTLTLLFAPAVVLGVAAAWFYHAIPIAVLPLMPSATPKENSAGVTRTAVPDAAFTLPSHAVVAVAIVAGAALLLWLLQLLAYSNLSPTWQRIYRWASSASVFMTQVAIVVAAVAVGVPVLVWLAGRSVSYFDASIAVGVGGSVSAVLLTYVASLASLLWRQLKTIRGAAGGRKSGTRVAVPRGLLQQLLVIVSVAVLVVSWLMLFGVSTIGTATDLGAGDRGPSLWLALALLAVVGLLGGLFDVASLSLHPFYRRRLASAFATRSVTVPTASGEATVAVPYHPRERTPISTYARPAEKAMPFPELVFAAAANLTGQQATPPGLTAVSFTMTADWVGGPDVGWVDTATLEKVSPSRLRRDVTVQAAVAISGAAIASSMGRFSRWYQIILAVSGARLGAWLPNPRFLSAMRAARDDDGHAVDWTLPGLPAVRRMSYLLREVLNIHPVEERLLQVTDGGHYENLGIVELLRRRCTTIYCIDGGGDAPPTAGGLAEAIALAESELGVQIVLHDPFDSEPGAGQPVGGAAGLAALNGELSKEPVITGTIRYPEASGLSDEARVGTLVVARALLWPELSYALLSYAAQHPEFPHDSTGDQWFGDDQFTAYTRLGRELGRRVRTVRTRHTRGPSRPSSPAPTVRQAGHPGVGHPDHATHEPHTDGWGTVLDQPV
jgi:hypothetical protein